MRIAAFALAATLLTAAPTAAFAGETMPPFAAEKSIAAPQIIKKTLANGLEVWVVPRLGVPRVDYVLAMRGAGLAADDRGHSGFATLLAQLLKEGTARHDSRAIAELIEGMGGTLTASASNDGLTISGNALASQAGPMMSLVAEVARQPAFPEKEVALAKANALQELKASEAQPRFRAERALNLAVFGDHPYGHITASAATIEAVDPTLLRAAHESRFRPERGLLVITGRIEPAKAVKLAERAFGDWRTKSRASTAPAEQSAAASEAKPARILLERKGSVQTTIRLGSTGIPASAEDYVPLRLTSTILGGGFSSRVNLNLREEKGYTYGASAGPRNFRDGGAMAGGADVRNEVTGAALSEFFAEYKRIGEQPVGSDEMEMNKRYVAGSYLITNQLQRAVAGTLANNWLIGLPSDFFGNFVPMMRQVTAEQVMAMGRKYFAPDRQSIILVGDKEAIGAQIATFGTFETP